MSRRDEPNNLHEPGDARGNEGAAERPIAPADIELSYDSTGFTGEIVKQLEGPLKEVIAASMNASAAGEPTAPADRARAEVGYAADDPIAIKMVNCALGTVDDLFTAELAKGLEEMFGCFLRDELDAISLEDAERTAELALQPLAALELLPDEFPLGGRQVFIEFARIAIPAYQTSRRIAEAIAAGRLESERVPIFLEWLGPCISPVSGDARRSAYGCYFRDAQRAATEHGRGDPTAAEALSYVDAWFSKERMASETERLAHPRAVDALCDRYPDLRAWAQNPQGAISTWLFVKERIARGDALPERGDWFDWL